MIRHLLLTALIALCLNTWLPSRCLSSPIPGGSQWIYLAGDGWYYSPVAKKWLMFVDPDVPTTELVLVEGGTLSAGPLSDTVVESFYMGSTEVTLGEWRMVRNWAQLYGYQITPDRGCADTVPVTYVSWYDCVKWCNAKSEMEGRQPVYTVDGEVYRVNEYGRYDSDLIEQDLLADGYRLPLEAEWSFAARGGNLSQGYSYAGSDDLNEVAWFYGNSLGSPCPIYEQRGPWPVAGKAPNELGLYDMSGNVEEWCWDLDAEDSFYRRVRGGFWESNAENSALSYRLFPRVPTVRFGSLGFRIARSIEQVPGED